MVLIGLFAALLALLAPQPAGAEPITIAIFGTVFAATALEAVTTAAITVAISLALSLAISFVASALFKPTGKGGAGGGQNSPINTNFNVRVAAGPRVVVYGKRRVNGTYGFMRLVQNNHGLNMVVLLAGHECQAVDEIIIADETFAFPSDFDGNGLLASGRSRLDGFVWVHVHLGSATQAADQFLIDDIALYEANGADIWGPDHRLRGVCYLSVRLQFGPEPAPGDPNGQPPLFSDGIPNIGAVVRGKNDIYDPRSATTGYSNNPALCLANYLCDTTYGLGITYATGINETALISAANSCDEDVSIVGGGTENRYECNGAFESSEQPQTIIGWLLGSMHGKAPYDGEKWTIMAGVYQTPTLTFTDDDLRAGMTVGSVTSRRDLFNTVKGTFTSPDHNWQEFDFPPVPSGTNAYATADGSTIYKDIKLPFTTSASMAQRIAKIDLLKARKQLTVKAPCKLTAWLCQAGDTIQWTSSRWGWSSKAFEVRKASFVVEDGEGGPTLGVDLELAETASSVYSWDTTEEQLLADMPTTNLGNVRTVYPPTNLTATEVIYTVLAGGGLKSRVDLTWAAPDDGFVNGYQPEYKLRADADYIPLPPITKTDNTSESYSIENLAPGVYDIRIAATNFIGYRSGYLNGTITVTGIGAVPENVSGFSVLAVGGSAQLRWTPTTDEQLRLAGGIEFRHAPVTSGATWATASPIGDVGIPALGFAIVPLKAGTYLARYFKILTGNVRQYSATPATFYNAQIALKSFSTLSTLTEDAAFTGTKSQVEVASSKLRLVSGKDNGQYDWSTYIDLGSVKNVRVTIGCAVAVTSRSDLVDSWADVDARPSWDTTVAGNEASVTHYIRYTQDDPAGSPTWTTLQKIDVAEFRARAFKFQTNFVALDPTWNIEVSALSAVVEESA